MEVFIVDDHPIVLQGLKNLLESREGIRVTGIFDQATTALTALDSPSPGCNLPQVMLMDINLPDVSGVTLCQQVKQAHPQIRIVALSIHNERSVIMSMLQSGASGYVLKNAIGDDIVAALHAAMEGQIYLCTETQKALNEAPGTEPKEIPRLTRREKEILELIGQGYTTQQIAAELFISTHTVESHRKNLKEKFGVPNTATVVRMAAELGLTR